MAEYLTYLRGYSPVRDDAAYARLDPQFGSRLTAMLQAAPEHVRRPDLIESLYRDNEGQARAIRQVADRMGIPFTPMLLSRGIPGYAAPVGGSRHQSGMAADINWSGLPPEGRDWLRSNAGAYGLRFPLPSTDAGHLELDPDWRGELPVSGAVATRPSAPPPIMNAAMYGMGAERPREPTPNLPPIMSAARMGFRDGGRVEAALRLAAKQTDKSPTDAQKESGRYAKGTFSWRGLKVAIENPKGSKRSGVDKNGKRWECTLPATYGFVRGTEAVDGDAVDCYVGPDHDSDKVFIIDQVDAETKKYDEPKCMLSYPDKAAALADYRKAFSDGKADARIGAVSQMSVDAFKDWVKSGAAKKPVGKFANGGQVTMKDVALDIARRFSRKKKAHGGRVGYEEGGEVLPFPLPPLPSQTGMEEGTLTGRENYTPPGRDMPTSDVVMRSILRGAADPLGILPTPAPYTVERPVSSLTGNENLSMRQRVDLSGDPDLEMAGAMVGGGPGIQAGMAGVRGLGRFAASHPMTTGLGSALGLTALGTSEATPAEPDEKRIRELEAEIARREKTLQGFATQNFQSKTAREAASQPHLDAITAARNEVTRIRDAQNKEGERQRTEERERIAREEASNTPFAKAHPWGPPALALAGAGVGGVLANSIARAGVRNYNTRINQLSDDWAAAIETGRNPRVSAGNRQLALEEAKALGEQFGSLEQRGARGAGPAITSAMAGTEVGLGLPTFIDYTTSTPGSKLREETFAHPADLALRMGLGAVGGAALGKGLTSFAQRNIAEPQNFSGLTSALERRSGMPPPTAPTPLQPLPGTLVEPPTPQALALPAPSSAPSTRTATPTPEVPAAASKPPHHSHLQPRQHGQFAGPPKKPRKPRRTPEQEAAEHHTRDDRLTRGQKNGGFVNSALDIARRFMGGRTWAPEVRPELPEAQFTYDERASRPLNLDLPMGLRETAVTRERFPGRELPDASDPLRGIGPQPPYAHGGSVSNGPVAGPVKGPTGGRADALPISVKSGAYVIPSDVVSGLPGAGNNTEAGMHLLEQMFGQPAPEARAAGGAIPDVPILISHGEFVVSPEQVAKLGNGDPDHGNRILDAFVKKMRAENIKHLRSLPGPAQS